MTKASPSLLQQILILFLLVLSGSCDGQVTIKLAIIPKIENSEFFLEVQDGCVTGARELSKTSSGHIIICDYIGPKSLKEDDIATQEQIEIVERIISNRSHDGIAIAVNDDIKLTPYLNKSVESGIPLITFDSDASNSKRYVYVGTNNTAFGDQMAKVLLQLKPGGGKFGFISGIAANLQERVDGFRSRVKNTSWIEVENSPKYGEGSTDISLFKMDDFVSEYPDIGAIIPVGFWPMNNSSGWKYFIERNRNISTVIGDANHLQIELISQGYGDGLVGQMPYEMGQLSASTLTKIILSNNTYVAEREVIFNTNILQIIRVPLVLPPLALDNNFLGGIKILNYVLFSAVAMVTLTFAFWTYWNRKKRVVRASQPFFLYLILIGILIMSGALITLTIDSERHSTHACSVACHLDIWFLTIGFTAVFAALFSKAWRVNIIMEKSMKFKRVLVRTRDVMLPFVVLLCINIAVLIAWTVHAPLHYIRQAHPGTDDWNREFSFYGECHSDHSTVYFAVVMVLEGICLVLAMYQTYKTRHYRTEFNESAYIGVAVVCIFQGFIVGLPVFILTRDSRRIMVPVVSLIVFFTCMSVLLFIFIPKIISQRKNDLEKADAVKHGKSGVLTRKYLESKKKSGYQMNSSPGLEHIPEEIRHDDDKRASNVKGLKIAKLRQRPLDLHHKEQEEEEEKEEITADEPSGLSLYKISIAHSCSKRSTTDS